MPTSSFSNAATAIYIYILYMYIVYCTGFASGHVMIVYISKFGQLPKTVAHWCFRGLP